MTAVFVVKSSQVWDACKVQQLQRKLDQLRRRHERCVKRAKHIEDVTSKLRELKQTIDYRPVGQTTEV